MKAKGSTQQVAQLLGPQDYRVCVLVQWVVCIPAFPGLETHGWVREPVLSLLSKMHQSTLLEDGLNFLGIILSITLPSQAEGGLSRMSWGRRGAPARGQAFVVSDGHSVG